MLAPSAKNSIEKLKSYKPNFGKACKTKLIRLSANESALGTSLKAVYAINNFSSNLNRYPPQVSKDLVDAIAKRYKIDNKKIILGNGSDELISILAQAFLGPDDECIYTEYGFLQFPQAIEIAGAKGIIAKDKHLTVNIDNIIGKITNKTKLIFLANANNPTGTFVPKKDIIRLHKSIPSDVLLVYDAAYSEFITHPDYIDGSELVNNNNNVIMLRTFSKMHGLASLRLGWGYCSNNIIDNLMKVRGPFSVNMLAMIAGKAAIEDINFQTKSIDHNTKSMKWLEKQLKDLGLSFEPSVTNFLLIKFSNEKRYNAQNAEKFLATKGILVRGMSVYNLSNYLRVSLGNDEENLTLIKELKAFLEKF